ncbi:hypothetical protein Tco_0436714 [Tanacetum coccineum]
MRRASKSYAGVDISLFPTMLVQGLVVQDEAASIHVDVKHGGAAINVTSLDAVEGSGNIDKTPTMPHDSPLLRVNTLGSDEGRMQHNELMDLVIKLSNRVKIVKSSEARRRAKIVVSDDEEYLEDPSKQGRKIDEIDQNPDITLPVYTTSAAITTARVTISTASPPRVSTADDISSAEKFVYIRRIASKEKGKAKMDEFKSVHTKIKLQQRQERLGYEAALRLQEQLDEEERQRIAKVHEEASSFNVEEWEAIQSRVEADEELAHRLQADEREKYFEAEKAKLLHIHDITWRLYDTCGVHHVSIKDGVDIYMLVEREYPLSRGVLTQMLGAKILVEQDNEMCRELLRKIFLQVERPRR